VLQYNIHRPEKLNIAPVAWEESSEEAAQRMSIHVAADIAEKLTNVREEQTSLSEDSTVRNNNCEDNLVKKKRNKQ